MSRRVSIGVNGSASPFVVSVDGYDAYSATNFTQILFDANQRPLRLYEIGYLGWVTSPSVGVGVNTLKGTTKYSFNTGYPIVFSAGKSDGGQIGPSYIKIDNPRDSPPAFYRQVGRGLIMSSDYYVYAASFNEQYLIPGSGATYVPPPVMMYYAILRNAG